MPINHVVLIQFKADASQEAIDEACARILSLKDTCIHPTTQKPYINSISGGKNLSKDAAQTGIQWGFVAEFNSLQDLEFYAETDESHRAVTDNLGEVVKGIYITDYSF